MKKDNEIVKVKTENTIIYSANENFTEKRNILWWKLKLQRENENFTVKMKIL